MKTLIITDLSVTSELDRAQLAAVRGGFGKDAYVQHMISGPKAPAHGYPSFDFNAAQSLGQMQNTTVNNGNNAAFVCGITANVNPTQNGTNTINFG